MRGGGCAGENVETSEALFTAGESVKWYTAVGNITASPQKPKRELPVYDAAILILVLSPKEQIKQGYEEVFINSNYLQ